MDLAGVAAVIALSGIPGSVLVGHWQRRAVLQQAESAYRAALETAEANHRTALEAAEANHRTAMEWPGS